MSCSLLSQSVLIVDKQLKRRLFELNKQNNQDNIVSSIPTCLHSDFINNLIIEKTIGYYCDGL